MRTPLRSGLRLGLLSLVLAAGCDADLQLVVDVVTDRAPVEEFDRVELRVEDAVSGEVVYEDTADVAADQDFTAGVRVATVRAIPAGDYRVVGRLSLGGEEVASRSTSVTVMTSYAVTLTFPSPRCAPGDEICNGLDDDCDGSVDEGDAAELCPLTAVDEPECAEGSCRILTCAANNDDCDGDASSGCETDLTNDDASCGACDAACGDGRVCNLAACRGMGTYVDDRVFASGRRWQVHARGDGFLLHASREWLAVDAALEDVWSRTFPDPPSGSLTVRTAAGPNGDAWALLSLTNWGSVDTTYDVGGATVTVPAGEDLSAVVRYAAEDGSYVDHGELPGLGGGDDASGERGGSGEILGVDTAAGYVLSGLVTDADLGGGPIAGRVLFVAAYEADHSLRWIWTTAFPDSARWDFQMGGAVTPSGEVATWLQPGFEGTLDFGSGPVVVTREMTVALFFRADGELAWFERYRADSVGGALSDDGTLTLVLAPPSAAPNPDSLVEVRDSAGALVEGYAIFPTNLIREPTVAVGRRGGLYLAGTLGIPVDFGGGRRAPLLDAGVLVAYGRDGTYRYDRFYSDPGSSRFVDIAVSGDRVLLSGAFTGELDFGGGARTGDTSPLLLLLED